MSFKLYLGINNLPKSFKKTVRVYNVKNYHILPELVELREGLDLSGAAKKLGLRQRQLAEIGITSKGIDKKLFRQALLKEIPTKLELRASEPRSAKNAFKAVVGRLGKEDQALTPIDLMDVIRTGKLTSYAKAKMVFESVRGLRDLETKASFVVDLAKELYPQLVVKQQQFAIGTASRLFSKDRHSMADFVYKLALRFYPDDIEWQKDFAEWSIENLHMEEEVNKLVFSERLAQRFGGEILIESVPVPDQIGKFLQAAGYSGKDSFATLEERTVKAARIHYINPITQGEFVGAVAQDYLCDPQTQRRLIEAVANRLHGINRIARAEVIAVAMGRLQLEKDPEESN